MTASLMRRFGAAFVSTLLVLGPVVAAHAEGEAPPKKQAAAKKEVAPGEAAPAATPAAALRHGARSKTPDGTVLVYDGVAGAWRAPAMPEAYWIGERFYRHDNGVWLSATTAAGPWNLVASAAVPEAARDRYVPPKLAVTAKLPSGVEAVYEPRLKVFKVAGHKGVFLFDGTFYRNENGLWLGAAGPEGPWTPASPKPLPVPLRKGVGEATDGQQATLPGGEVVVWDGTSKVFTLRDKPDTVLHDGKFWEKREEKWFESASPGTGFVEAANKDVPAAVRFKFRKEPEAGAKPKKAGGKAGKDGEKKKAGGKTAAERQQGKPAGADKAKKQPSTTAGEDAE